MTTRRAAVSDAWVIGVDVGASGARARAVRLGSPGDGSGGDALEGIGAGAIATGEGASAAVLGVLEALVGRSAGAFEAGGVAAVAVGATGLGTLGASHEALRAAVGSLTGALAVVVATDAVTAHVGALAGEPGATVAAGTGTIALAQSASGELHRVDGWGHLLGDVGSAAWIGQRGLAAALAAHDLRDPAGTALLVEARARLGDPLTWPAALYGRDDRAAVMASFAPAVTDLAEAGDAAATAIAAEAAEALAAAAAACLRRRCVPAVVARTGGVFRSALVRRLFDEQVGRVAEVRPAAGTPLDGAVQLAVRRATGAPGRSVPGLLTW